MNNVDHLGELAGALNRLIAAPSQVNDSERQIIAGHAASVAGALADLHRLMFPGLRIDSSRRTVAALSTHPVSVLGVLLDANRRTADCPLSPVDRLTRPVSSATAAAWRDAERHAILAADNASRLDEGWANDPAVAWQAVADITDISHAFAIVDEALGKSSSDDEHGPQRERDSPAALRLAAEHVAALARSGPLNLEIVPPAVERTQPRLLQLSGIESLAEAQRRVAAMLDGAEPCIAPEMLTRVLTRQAHAHLAAADVLSRLKPTTESERHAVRAAADAVGMRARYLVLVARTLAGVRGLYRGGERPVRQSAEILAALNGLAPNALGREIADLAEIVKWGVAGGQLVQALARHTTRALAGDEWCVGNPRTAGRTAASAWVPASYRVREPAVVAATQRLVAAERAITADLKAAAKRFGMAPARSPASEATREALRQTLNTYRVARPRLPNHPAAHPRQRGSATRPC